MVHFQGKTITRFCSSSLSCCFTTASPDASNVILPTTKKKSNRKSSTDCGLNTERAKSGFPMSTRLTSRYIDWILPNPSYPTCLAHNCFYTFTIWRIEALKEWKSSCQHLNAMYQSNLRKNSIFRGDCLDQWSRCNRLRKGVTLDMKVVRGRKER